MYDLIIKNANIIDGTGAASFFGNIFIKHGKITKITQNTNQTEDNAKQTLDISGLTVTPGWIDSHSHSDRNIISHPDQKEKVEQGITFSITGQCGGSPAPLKTKDKLETMGDYLKIAQDTPQGSGSAILVGHNSLRKAVMDKENRKPTAEELDKMKELLEDAMEHGAIGMSLGLYYVPGCYADTEEVIELGKIVAKQGGILSSHIRNENDGLLEATNEFLDIIKATGCRAVFSHHKAQDSCNWGKVKHTLEMIDQANRDGFDIYVDVYPYTASSTSMLSRFVPSCFHPPMTTNVLNILDDPSICQAIKDWGHKKWGNDLSWVLVSVCGNHPEYSGLTVNEIADKKGLSDRYDAVFEIAKEGKGLTNIITFMMCEDDIEYIMKHPRSMLCTDASSRITNGRYHPRMFASFPRVLGKYVREKNTAPLTEMIRKMTSLPAHVYGLKTKGKIAEGFDADLCIFDPNTITDNADYINFDTANTGIEYVLIDGKIILEHGKYNGIRAAKVLTNFK